MLELPHTTTDDFVVHRPHRLGLETADLALRTANVALDARKLGLKPSPVATPVDVRNEEEGHNHGRCHKKRGHRRIRRAVSSTTPISLITSDRQMASIPQAADGTI